jgi:hypothetical protein
MKTRCLITTLLFAMRVDSCFGQAPGLESFSHCNLGSDFQIAQVDRLANAMTRSVETSSGSKEIAMTDGYRILIAFEQEEPFVNLKAEQLEKWRYANDKQSLISSLEFSAKGTPNMESDKSAKTKRGRFETYGINRKRLEGGVLSTYILFDDSSAQILTAYILNDEPDHRKFQTITEYKELRDRFLRKLSSCNAP